MQDAQEVRRRKRRSNRAVFVGSCWMVLALVASAAELVPPLASTIVAIAGFVLLMYGVHLGWLVVYERDPDGPSS
jgi:Flp pilus assembly protein protease CpaA